MFSHNNFELSSFQVHDSEDVKTLKMLIQNETGFPPCEQNLTGWQSNSPHVIVTDRRRLSHLSLPKENFLRLLVPEISASGTNGESLSDE